MAVGNWNGNKNKNGSIVTAMPRRADEDAIAPSSSMNCIVRSGLLRILASGTVS